MRGDIAFAGFVLTVAEWHAILDELDASEIYESYQLEFD